MECTNCKENGVYIALVDRGDHYFCFKCGQRQEKPTVKRYVFDVNPWDKEVNY